MAHSKENNISNEDRLITVLRRRLLFTPDLVTDEQILKITKGTRVLFVARLELAGQDLSEAWRLLGEAATQAFKKMRNIWG